MFVMFVLGENCLGGHLWIFEIECCNSTMDYRMDKYSIHGGEVFFFGFFKLPPIYENNLVGHSC